MPLICNLALMLVSIYFERNNMFFDRNHTYLELLLQRRLPNQRQLQPRRQHQLQSRQLRQPPLRLRNPLQFRPPSQRQLQPRNQPLLQRQLQSPQPLRLRSLRLLQPRSLQLPLQLLLQVFFAAFFRPQFLNFIAATLVVYDDAFENSFQDKSSGSSNAKDTTTFHSGANSLKATIRSYGALEMICTGCVDTSVYHSVSFWINAGAGGQCKYYLL